VEPQKKKKEKKNTDKKIHCIREAIDKTTRKCENEKREKGKREKQNGGGRD
jgi:hypothetical protein